MDAIYKTLKAEVRGVNVETGEVDIFIPVSTDSVDRDGDIIEPLAFKKTLPKFMKRPVLVSSHNYRDLTSQIGEWTKLKIGENGLEGKPRYYVNEGNEQADWGFKLASKGMAAFSIGFIPKQWEDGTGEKAPRRTFKEVELLEISQVIVPSNREAIQSIRAKGFQNPIVEEICQEVEKELISKPEETEEFIHIPAPGQEGKHEGHRIRVIPIDKDKGIQAKYCGECKKITSYMFAKDHDWTMEKAKQWVKEHEGKLFEPREVSQEEIRDEFDYLQALITKEDLEGKTKFSMWTLTKEILRLYGSEIPSDIKELITPKPIEPERKEISPEQVQTIVATEIAKAIRKAQGALE